MHYPLEVEGFEGHKISVESQGFIRRPRLFFDGHLAKEGAKKGQYVLQRNDGLKVTAQVNPRPFDLVPRVLIDGEQVYVAEPLRFYQVLWSALPLLMVFIGGLIGGFIGACAFWANLKVFRSEIHPLEKYILSGSISLIALFAYLLLVFLIALILVGS